MVVAIVLILLLSQVLWWTLKRTALQPLELQIRQREEKERELLRRTVRTNQPEALLAAEAASHLSA